MSEVIMEEDDYESLPPTSGIATHMIAGAAAGIMEHCIMYPVDCVKTRMQCLVPNPQANYRNLADAFHRIIRTEGLKNTLRGVNAMVGGAGPAHAMYFACYEKLKKVLSSQNPGHHHLAHGAAGCGATLLHDIVMNPAEVIKQRMQVYGSPYRSCMECARDVLQREGSGAFYRSFTTQLSMNIPFQSLHFMVYEYCQDTLNSDRSYSPGTHVISGAAAGAVASAVTTPLDVCKTLLNTQEKCALGEGTSAIRGIPHAVRTIYQFRGLRGFWQGVTARVVYQMPSTAISWTVYEFFKYFISKQQNADCDDRYSAPMVTGVQVHAAVRGERPA